MGLDRRDTVPDACRTDCREAWCGDQVVDTNEQCDNGASNSDSVPDACRTDCVEAHCGDGVLDAGEQCDDAGTAPGDGCDASCEREFVPDDGFCDLAHSENALNSPADCDFVILHYTFDATDRVGETYHDVGGLGLDGEGTDTSTVPSPWGDALSCNGTSSIVELPRTAMDNLTGFTVELYYLWTGTTWGSSGGQALFSRKDPDDAAMVSLFVMDATSAAYFAAFPLSSPYWVTGGPSLRDGLWHHVAATWDGADMSVYVDHQLVGVLAHAGALGTNTDEDVLLCNAPERSYFAEAAIDHFRISSRALVPAEFMPPVP